jgi:hypothetical protein
MQKLNKKDLIKYWSSIGQEFSSKIDRISHLIGDEHYPSSGRYRERILIEVITKFLPKRYSVGTGFVLFPALYISNESKDNLDIFTHEVSKELDVIIYDSTNFSPIYQDGDFVIVKPESVRSVIEVKSTLKLSEIAKSVQNYIDFAFKWYRFSQNHQPLLDEPLKRPGLFIMNWTVARGNKNQLKPGSKAVLSKIIQGYQKEEVPRLYCKEKNFPFISACFVYNEFIVSDAEILLPNGSTEYGYIMSSGRFDAPEDNTYAFYEDDKTISSLLYYIDLFLDTSLFNTIYTRPSSMFPVKHKKNQSLALFSFTKEEYFELFESQTRP